MTVGRNEPCPCGSGRKYKHCCLAATELTDARWLAWRRAEGVLDRIEAFAAETWGGPLIEEALATFWAGSPPPQSEQDALRWGQLFRPWFSFHFIPEPRRSRRDKTGRWPTDALAREFVRYPDSHVSPIEQRFIEAACDAPFSFMAVQAVEPGRSIDLQDILTGESHHVLERTGSADLEPGLVLLTRVVADGDIAVMSGLGPYPLVPAERGHIIDFREEFLGGGGSLDHARLRAVTLPILWLYQRLVDAALNPAPPRLVNTDGDPLAPTTLVFELRCTVQSALDRLKVLSLDRSDDYLLAESERSATGDLTKVVFAWSKKGNKQHREWTDTILGQLTLTPGELSVSVNSAKRARRIRGLVEKHLGQDALFLRHTVESVEAMLDPRRRAAALEARSADDEPFESSPEGQALMAEMHRKHWEAWLDTKIPALGNLSPRRAAATPLGRERLEALLADFAWRANRSQSNLLHPDVEWIRRQLGLGGPVIDASRQGQP